MKKTGNVWIGIAIGGAIPFILVGIINIALIMAGKYLKPEIFQATLLLGVGVNAILIRYLFKKDKDFTSRGIMVSSMLIFLYWVLRFMVFEN